MYIRVVLALLAACLAPAAAWSAVTHINKTVAVVHSPDGRECIFFQLQGVAEADPASPNNPWFAVPQTHKGYKEIAATLLMLRTTGTPLQHVATNGALVCGHAEVTSISF